MESLRLSRRVNQLEAFLRFLNAAQTEIRYSSIPVDQIIRKHGDRLKFLAGFFPLSAQESFEAQWRGCVGEHGKASGLNAKDIELIQDFGSGFGASDLEGQLSHCTLYFDLLHVRLGDAKEEKEKKSKLYLMLGVFAGAAAALLLC